MGVTITHDPWADGEYLKFAIGATAITATNAPPLAVMRNSAVTVVPAGPVNSTKGCGFPYVVLEIQFAEITDTVKPDSTWDRNGARSSRRDENPIV